MQTRILLASGAVLVASTVLTASAFAQMGRRLPSEKKVVPDPVTGVPLTFLTTDPASDSKIYQTHRQWTADGKWLIFRGNRGTGPQAFAVNEDSGVIVQVTENGYMGMLCAAHKSMKLYIMRNPGGSFGRGRGGGGTNAPSAVASGTSSATAGTNDAVTAAGGRRGGRGTGFGRGGQQIIEIDLAKLFADSEAGTMKAPSNYERVCGTVPPGINAGGNMGLDANDDVMYFSVTGPDTAQLSEGMKLEQAFGPRSMGAGPSGLRSMNLKTGEVKLVCNVGFQIGHVQTNPWVPGEIVFCWETGGKAPQRTWTVMADGTGLRPLYPEAPYEWITHEAVITTNEVVIAILCHRRPGVNDAWGTSGTSEHPTGVGIVNLRTREMRIVGQVPLGNPGRSDWHVHGSPDGRWAIRRPRPITSIRRSARTARGSRFKRRCWLRTAMPWTSAWSPSRKLGWTASKQKPAVVGDRDRALSRRTRWSLIEKKYDDTMKRRGAIYRKERCEPRVPMVHWDTTQTQRKLK